MTVPTVPPVTLPPIVPVVIPVAPTFDDVLAGIDISLVRGEAARWAGRNDSDIESVILDLDTLTVRVRARTKGSIGGFGGGQRGHADARARLEVSGVCLPAAAVGNRPGLPVCLPGVRPGLGNASFTVELVE